MNERQVVEGRLKQGADERIARTLTTTPWGATPSGAVVKLFDISTGIKEDVSATKLAGESSITGDVITTPLVIGLVAGNLYRLEIRFVSGGNTFEAWAEIQGEE